MIHFSFFFKASGGSTSVASSAASVKEYERLIADHFPKLLTLSKQIGSDVAEQVFILFDHHHN
jgi:hypothetical protein